MMRYLALAFCLPALLFATSEDEAVRKIQEHLLLCDPTSAAAQARASLESYPSSDRLHLALVHALCEEGQENEALAQAEFFFSEDKKATRPLYEMLAWGVLKKAEHSSQLLVRINALLGASLTADIKGAQLLLEGIRDSNAILRSLAVRLTASFGDTSLQDELVRLLKEEKVWYVRLDVIQAIGHLHLVKLRSELQEIIANPKTIIEERVAALSALVSMCDEISSQELAYLIKSDRAGLRQLACQVVIHLDLKERVNELLPLLFDASSDVRISALNAFCLLGKRDPALFVRHLEDPVPEVAITAAWALLIAGEQAGEERLKGWIECATPALRRLASAALASCGKKAVASSLALIKSSQDPYVKANLALGLIGQRERIHLACDTLFGVLAHVEKMMWDNQSNPIFRTLCPSELRHRPEVPQYPKLIDQFVRLDLLSVLSIMRYNKAQEAVKSFLQNDAWGVVGSAAATLLGEGNEEGLALVRTLLGDPEEKIRIQAALILALYGGDPSAVEVLEKAYPLVEREVKVSILEALGRIGDPRSIPFLLSELKEPYQTLRVVAATALIQCLYH